MDVMIIRKSDFANTTFYGNIISFEKILIDGRDHWQILLRPDDEYDYKSATYNCREWMLLRSEDPKMLPYGTSKEQIMKECKYYERDEDAFAEHIDYMRHCAAEGTAGYEPDEEPERLCDSFCKHYCESNGYPGEILCYCGHPENPGVDLGSYSMFDGVDDQQEL